MSLTSLQSSLAHVQSNVNELLRTYMQHTSSILAGEDGDLEKLQLPANITATANAAMEAATTAVSGISQAVNAANQAEGPAADGKNKKRKREKKEKDPNAPKKPLTAAFLYAQTARPIVRTDLEAALGPGQILEKNAVNLEVNKRWNELPEEEKEVRFCVTFGDGDHGTNSIRNGRHLIAALWRSGKWKWLSISLRPAAKLSTST
jgi:hypothetical protein|tara:strand:- start:5101 stop:5715 length:615 start_codon:yes stop_codon:yes gene_type:complete